MDTMRRKKWYNHELDEIARYMIKEHRTNTLEKPTVMSFVQRMSENLPQMQCTDFRQFGNIYQRMKKVYRQTKEWVTTNGMELEMKDPSTFPDLVKLKCSYYFILEEIWGDNSVGTMPSVAINSTENSVEFESSWTYPQSTVDFDTPEKGEKRSRMNSLEDEGEIMVEWQKNNTLSDDGDRFHKRSCLSQEQLEFEREKLKFKREKFNEMMEIRRERNQQMVLEKEKDRQHAKEMKQMELEYELRKLELQLKWKNGHSN